MAALCSCCLVQFRIAAKENNVDIKIEDFGALAARSLGYDLPDTTNDALVAWATFDKMMEPENMAEDDATAHAITDAKGHAEDAQGC